jgi:two-component system, chemotaxis family, sensor kinase CheA
MNLAEPFASLLEAIASRIILAEPGAPELATVLGDLDSLAPAIGALPAFARARELAERMLKGGDEETLASLNAAVSDLQREVRDAAEGSGAPESHPAAPAPTAPPTSVARDEETLALLGAFLDESEDGLRRADGSLLEIEKHGADPAAINALFRVFHTIKGAASFLELSGVATLAHATENVLNLARQGTLGLAGEVLDAVFDATGRTAGLLAEVRANVAAGAPFAAPDLAETLARLAGCCAGAATVAPAAPAPAPAAAAPAPVAAAPRAPAAAAPAAAAPAPAAAAPAAAAPAPIAAAPRAPAAAAPAPTAAAPAPAAAAPAPAAAAAPAPAPAVAAPAPAAAPAAAAPTAAAPAPAAAAPAAAPSAPTPPASAAAAPPAPAAAAPPAPAADADAQGRGPAADEEAGQRLRETIKVDVGRIDDLVEMIGELVVVQAMVQNAPELTERSTPRLADSLGQLSRITRDLQGVGMRMRMVPVRGVFQKMARLVRDLSRKSGKRVVLETSGEATEMDRSMVEHIDDPLVHMIRNAIDHGVESPEERRARGKPEVAVLRLSAYHEGGNIFLSLADDGRGLDRNAILAKGRAQNLVRAGDDLSDSDVYSLIFLPGFSTAKKVTEISGRGVGMDVVKRNVEAMRGRTLIESRPGEGTTFKIALPLTLAIIDGMLVACGGEQYIVPTLNIVESLRPDREAIAAPADHGEVVVVRGDILPLVRLGELFRVRGAVEDPTAGQVVIVETVGARLGLLVDDVLTQQQVVIKSLGPALRRTPYVAGGAILADGRVGLIVNVDDIGAEMRERRRQGTLSHPARSAA